jgi:hypothetical protein
LTRRIGWLDKLGTSNVYGFHLQRNGWRSGAQTNLELLMANLGKGQKTHLDENRRETSSTKVDRRTALKGRTKLAPLYSFVNRNEACF